MPENFRNLPDVNGYEHVPVWVLGGSLVVFGLWPRLILDIIDASSTAASTLLPWGAP